MKKILIGLGVLVVLAGAVVTWWTYEFPSATWRYKITVEVETPEGLKTGTAVRQLRQYTDIKLEIRAEDLPEQAEKQLSLIWISVESFYDCW